MNVSTNDLTINVRKLSSGFGIALSDGRELPIKLNGAVAAFAPGWSPLFIYAGFLPLLILELKHENGSGSLWFLDNELNWIAFSSKELEGEWLECLQTMASRLGGELFDGLVAKNAPGLTPACRGFFRLSQATRMNVLTGSSPEAQFSASVIDVSRAAGDVFLSPRSDNAEPTAVSRARLAALLNLSIRELFFASLRGQGLAFPSPVDGASLTTDQSICLGDMVALYPVFDKKNKLPFVVICGSHDFEILGLILPLSRQIFCRDTRRIRELEIQFPRGLWFYLVEHLFRYGDRLANYLQAPARQPVIFTRFTHLGHDLHNELSGLLQLVQAVPRQSIPEVLIYRGKLGSEVYGRTEQIIPELDGKLSRNLSTWQELIEYCYDHRKCLYRITRTFVANDLRERILRVNLGKGEFKEDRALLERIRERKFAIVLLGLRVENRTLVDLPAFCEKLVEFLLSRANGCAVVVDGHVSLNEEVGKDIPQSTREHTASKSPVAVETEIARQLAKKFAGRSNVAIINNVGATMRRALFWCVNSDFFVAIGGSGLARYRWVCNKPGLVISNHDGLTGGAMHIYQPPIMEESSPIWFLKKEFVTDRPEAVPLVPFEHDPPRPFWFNFTINEEAAFAATEKLLKEYASSAVKASQGPIARSWQRFTNTVR